MIVVYKYQLTDLGMNNEGVHKIIEDWMKHVASNIPSLIESDYKFVIMMHPEMRRIVAMSTSPTLSNYSLNIVRNPGAEDITGADGTFPRIVEAQCTIMNLQIVTTTVLAENELVIASEEFIPLVEGFIRRRTEEAYQKGAFDAIRMNPNTAMYDENYVFVNLKDEKSMKMLMKRAKRRMNK